MGTRISFLKGIKRQAPQAREKIGVLGQKYAKIQFGQIPCRTPPGGGGWGPDLKGISKITGNL